MSAPLILLMYKTCSNFIQMANNNGAIEQQQETEAGNWEFLGNWITYGWGVGGYTALALATNSFWANPKHKARDFDL